MRLGQGVLSKVPRRTLKCLPTPEPCGEHCSITSFLESALAEKLRLQSFVSFLLTFNSLNIHLASQSRAWESPPLPLTHPRDPPPPEGRRPLCHPQLAGATATVSLVGQLLLGSRQEGEVIQSRDRTGVPGSMPRVGGKGGQEGAPK